MIKQSNKFPNFIRLYKILQSNNYSLIIKYKYYLVLFTDK